MISTSESCICFVYATKLAYFPILILKFLQNFVSLPNRQ
jgi:hypothetical protein